MTDNMGDIMDYEFDIEDNLELLGLPCGDSFDSHGSFLLFNNNYDASIAIGDPDASGHIFQTTNFTCAVVSQEMILQEFLAVNPATGLPLTEAELIYEGTVNGWLTDNGTSPDNMGKLLEYYGVDCHHGAGMENMVCELAEGHKVIVAVDADELWGQENAVFNDLKDILDGERANHALVIKGIKFKEDGEPVVVVNDPGDPAGAGKEYSMEVFQDAFEDSGCHFVATDNAPVNLVNEQYGANYDDKLGRYAASEGWSEPISTDYIAQKDNYHTNRSIENLTEIDRKNILRNI